VEVDLCARLQARELCALVDTLDGPLVMGGDLNATPDRRAPARIASRLRDAWAEVGVGNGATFPADAPTSRIDYVYARGPVGIRSISVGARGAQIASDHLPVVVELSIG
jgi:endonuclease/exonuclease/phosphatase (EEP) superfamily protein YafD